MSKDLAVDLLQETLTTLRHARTFITSRERMHPDGVKLYDELYATLSADLPQQITRESLVRSLARQHAINMRIVGGLKQYANDLRRNSSGSDDYPYERMGFIADEIERLIGEPSYLTDSAPVD